MALGNRYSFALLALVCLLGLFGCKPTQTDVDVERLDPSAQQPVADLDAIAISDIQIQHNQFIVVGEGFTKDIVGVSLNDGVTEHPLNIVSVDTTQLLLEATVSAAALLVGGIVDLVISGANADTQTHSLELVLANNTVTPPNTHRLFQRITG